jgi:ketosteroid isomerase-like protein
VVFDSMAIAIDWLDEYRAKSLALLDFYAEDAVIMCGCGTEKALSGRTALQSYWLTYFDENLSIDLIGLEDRGGDVVAVTYRTPHRVVRTILVFDARTGLITLQRCGPW